MKLQSLIALVLGPFVGIVMSAALLQPTSSYGSEAVQLPAPQMHGGMPLMEALSQRRSIRSFAEADLDKATLSTLLWAAFGINRPDTGDRTAPSWRGSKETDIYVARADGVWLYDPQSHSLQQVLEDDIRAETGRQPFVEAAPIVLIYVAERRRMAEAPEDEHRLYAHVDTALIAQNVYLFAASEGLATVVLGNVDKPALAATLGLGDDQILTFTQPVGHRQ